MIKLRLFIALLFTVNIAPAQFVPSSIDQIINADSLKRLVSILSADSMKGRLTESPEALTAARFISSEFNKAGLFQIEKSTDSIGRFITVDGNVAGILPGDSLKNELVIFCAHFDHIGTLASKSFSTPPTSSPGKGNDSIYNGANDNASGMSAVIALARFYAAQTTQNRSIMFVGFTGEELGLIGSSRFANFVNPEYIMVVFNLEMLGRGKRPFITGAEFSDFRDILNEKLFNYDPANYKKRFFKADDSGQKLFFRSDNLPFARKRIPAHTIMATIPTDRYYHSLEDEYQTINYHSMARIVKAVAIAAETIINGSKTPSRLNRINE